MMKHFQKTTSFWAGVASTLLVVSMGTTLAGAATDLPGKTIYNQAGITIFGEEAIKKGGSFLAPNGQNVPSVITYVDETGGKTNYLSIRQLSELLDAEIAWNPGTGNIDIAPAGNGSVDVTHGERPGIAAVPEYGRKAGPFTEVDPQSVDIDGKKALIQVPYSHETSSTGCYIPTEFRARGGSIILFEVTNNGDYTQAVQARRPITISNRPADPFTTVTLEPGQSLTRAFTLDASASRLQSKLDFVIDSVGSGHPTDITVTVSQYK